MGELDDPITKGDVYHDKVSDLYVKVYKIFISEDGSTEVRIEQFTDTPIAAHTSAAYSDQYEKWRLIDGEGFHERVAEGELVRQESHTKL